MCIRDSLLAPEPGRTEALGIVLAVVGVDALVFVALARVLRLTEVAEVVALLTRRAAAPVR